MVVPATDLEARVIERLGDLKDKVQLKGFRPGKVPVAHLKRLYGKSAMAEVIEAAVREANSKIVTDHKLKLATEPKVLLLDEAMAGLTQREVQLAIDLVRDIHHSGITLVIVEHIMEVIMTLTSRVIVFHQGHVIAKGTPTDVVKDEAVIEAYLGRGHRQWRKKNAGGA